MFDIKGKCILFADDEKFLMKATIEMLELKGATVILVDNGTSVIQYLEKKMQPVPEILILDIMMHSGDAIITNDEARSTGAQVYKVIRDRLNMEIPIVVSTGVSDQRIMAAFPESDTKVRIIYKPYLFTELLDAITYLFCK